MVRCKENLSRVCLLSPSWERASTGARTHEGTRPTTSNLCVSFLLSIFTFGRKHAVNTRLGSAPSFRSGRHKHIIRIIFLSPYPVLHAATEHTAE